MLGGRLAHNKEYNVLCTATIAAPNWPAAVVDADDFMTKNNGQLVSITYKNAILPKDPDNT